MKKLLSILTITTLTASIPAPLLANTVQSRAKRDIGATAKDVTTGFDLKIKEKWNWQQVKAQDEPFRNIDNKWYFVVWRAQKGNNWGTTFFLNNSDKSRTIEKTLSLANLKGFLDLFAGGVGGSLERVWSNDNGTYFKSVFCWDGNDKPIMPIINASTGEITNWNQPTHNDFQQVISFSLAENDKTATWSNSGMRLTVDGETNININNSNVEEVYWDGIKQNMLEHKVNINLKPETNEKTHKLVIKYDINGTKYTSEDVDVVMAAKIEPKPTPVLKQLSELITNTDLGDVTDSNDDTIKTKIIEKNSLAIDFSQIELTDKTETQATLTAKSDSKSYAGSVDVTYNVVPATTVDLKIDVTSLASGVQIDKDYLAQLDSSKMTNKVNTFYYANGKSTIKIKQPSTGNVITGVVYGCDDKWNKTSQTSTINPTNSLQIDKGEYGSVDGRYLIELQHKDLPTHTKTIYLQVSEKQIMPHYFDTDNGKQFEQWAEDNGYKNIRGSSASQLNNLFELSKTWKQSLAHLDLKLDNFVVDNIKNVTQDEIDNYKTKMLASVKEQVEKYVPNVVENTDYVISVDNFVAGDWTTSKDIKVQSVNGSTKLLSFAIKTIPVQQKDQPTPTPVPSDKGVKSFWKILGIVVGVLAGVGLVGMLLWRYWLRPWRTKIRNARSDKRVAERRAQWAKEEAEVKAKAEQESGGKTDDGNNS